jgi:RluA family pseudouridine synthase
MFTVEQSENNLTVLEFLQRRIPAAPKGYLRQLLKKGKVHDTTGPVTAQDRLHPGDKVKLPYSDRLRKLIDMPPPPVIDVTILYESREILIVDKPAGLAIHAGVGHEDDNLTGRVESLLTQRGDKFKVAPIHRLDLETSGPVLFGKGKRACSELGKMFMRHDVDKYYLALAAGKTPSSGKLRSTILAKGKPKEALTEFRALNRTDKATLLELRLHSGRQHQIRRQLADLGHPIFGDRRYGGPCPAELPRIFLHCCRLAFIDPFSGARLNIRSPLPADLENFLSVCDI